MILTIRIVITICPFMRTIILTLDKFIVLFTFFVFTRRITFLIIHYSIIGVPLMRVFARRRGFTRRGIAMSGIFIVANEFSIVPTIDTHAPSQTGSILASTRRATAPAC
jgi:hypothetical protein